jgi:hypothetical protein
MIPNPSSGIANLSIIPLLNNDKVINFDLYDLAGRKILSIVNFDNSVNQIDMTSISSGTYIYQIRFNSEIHSGKLNIIK